MLAAIGAAQAGEIGRLGPTYAIQEVDGRVAADAQKARMAARSHEFEVKAREGSRQFLDRLPPIKDMARVERSQRRFVDLVHVVPQDVQDSQGRVVLKAGTSVNYGHRARFDGLLYLFDGGDPRQVALLERLWNAKLKVQPILVAGSYTQLVKRFRRPFYYDYGGAISRKLTVTRVPALVGQDGNRLRIEEIKP
ncbi:hypothetical protein [Ramlibacter humi]|nr:hypothetical protein [Ramlibacter humi]